MVRFPWQRGGKERGVYLRTESLGASLLHSKYANLLQQKPQTQLFQETNCLQPTSLGEPAPQYRCFPEPQEGKRKLTGGAGVLELENTNLELDCCYKIPRTKPSTVLNRQQPLFNNATSPELYWEVSSSYS